METSVRNSRKNRVRQANGDRKTHLGQRETDKQNQVVLQMELCIVFRDRESENCIHGGLAQLVERLLCKQEVSGSTPLISTIWADSSAG